MKLSGEQKIPASRQRVWEGLNDPEILKQCIKGCEYIAKTGDNVFSARVVAKVGTLIKDTVRKWRMAGFR